MPDFYSGFLVCGQMVQKQKRPGQTARAASEWRNELFSLSKNYHRRLSIRRVPVHAEHERNLARRWCVLRVEREDARLDEDFGAPPGQGRAATGIPTTLLRPISRTLREDRRVTT